MTAALIRKDFDAGIDVRWCPGCGDYAILATLQKTLPSLGIPKEKIVFISGIGCSSRFPYYMNTYGFHTIHGRAPAIATGLRAHRDDLSVWVITGDGDGLSIGTGHLIHALRRNVNLNILLFNNRIYGLTKGQYSPTSQVGTKTKSTPMGSIDAPLSPIPMALAAGATFAARVADTDAKLMQEVFAAAQAHQGTSFIEILQNCPVFNDGAFEAAQDKKQAAEKVLRLEAGRPMRFGKAAPQKVCFGMDGLEVRADDAPGEALRHDPSRENPMIAEALARLEAPIPVGILRQIQRPVYEDSLRAQLKEAQKQPGAGDLQGLLRGKDTWRVE